MRTAEEVRPISGGARLPPRVRTVPPCMFFVWKFHFHNIEKTFPRQRIFFLCRGKIFPSIQLLIL